MYIANQAYNMRSKNILVRAALKGRGSHVVDWGFVM